MGGKILVTGATGKLGREVVKKLIEKEEQVIAGVRDIEKAKEMGLNDVELREFNYDAPATFKDALAQVGAIFMVAPPQDPIVYDHIKPLFDRALEYNVDKIVSLSSLGVKTGDSTGFGKVDRLIEASPMEYTFIRPNWFMQNFIRLANNGLGKKGVIKVPAGKAKTSFIDVRDIAAIAAEALAEDNHNGKTYELTGQEAIDHYQAAEIISEATGKKIQYDEITQEEFSNALKKQGMLEPRIKVNEYLFSSIRDGKTETITGDLKEALGRDPIDFKTFAEDYKASW